jgi:hypothetical protein
MSEDWTVAKGSTGEIWASPGGVVIRRHGVRAMLRYGNVGELRIPIEDVAAVQLKPAGMTPGWLRLALHGQAEGRLGSHSDNHDPHLMEFSAQQQPDFEVVRGIIDHALTEARRHLAPAITNDSTDLAAQIKRLVQLREQGQLSEDQFNQRKSELLSGR